MMGRFRGPGGKIREAWILCVSAALVPLASFSAAAQTGPEKPYVKDPRYWPTPVMDSERPKLPQLKASRAVLIFSKTNGFRDNAQIEAADAAVKDIVEGRHWDAVVTENAAIFNTEQLSRFDVVVLNSTSGNIFTNDQRAAFRAWVEGGGGVVALHGSGGDPHYDWQWYVDTLIGAQFIGHTSKPKQFQTGTIRIVDRSHPTMRGLPFNWTREEEWYAFDRVPTGPGTRILALLDEGSYEPAASQRMGRHPIIWSRCVGKGRLFFSALGHKAETYREPDHLKLIGNAIRWAAQSKRHGCS